MWAILLLWAVVFFAAGLFVGIMLPHLLEGDPVDQLAKRDRRRHT